MSLPLLGAGPDLDGGGAGPIFPDEDFNDPAKFDFANAGGRINVTGGSLVMSGARSTDFVLLAGADNTAMLARLTEGVVYDCTFSSSGGGSSGNPQISLKGGAGVAISLGNVTVQVTAGSSGAEAFRLTGSGNAVSGNATRTWSALVITPH